MIPLFQVAMNPEVCQPVSHVLLSGYIGQGAKVEEFEKLLRDHFSVPFVNTTNSGTSALHLAIRCVKTHHPDDEILTTPLTCTATNFAILANNVKLRWVDVDPETCNIDLTDLERKLSKNTVAVMIVHWGGYPVDIDRLRQIQKRFKNAYGFAFTIIEDCAHAWGSKYKGKYVGTHGNLSAFSFQAIKSLTTIDGGALVCPSESLFKKTKLLRWYGIDREGPREDFRCEQDIAAWGYKFHMNDVNATVGLSNYKYSLETVLKNQENAKFYDEELRNVPGLSLMQRKEGFESSFWIYTIRVQRRDDFMKKMNKAGIMVSRVHERNDRHTCVSRYRSFLPSLDKLSKDMICIPVGFWVTEKERNHIVKTIKESW